MKINKKWIGLKVFFTGGAIMIFGMLIQQEKYGIGYFISLTGILIGIAGGIFHTVHTLKTLATPEK